MSRYILPVTTGVLLLLFFLCLPPLQDTPVDLPDPDGEVRRRPGTITRLDCLLLCCFVLVFGAVDFYGLGNRTSPESFLPVQNEPVLITFPEEKDVSLIVVFTGVGYGEFTFEASADGEEYFPITTFIQNAGDVLRWTNIQPDSVFHAKTVRLSGSGSAWLGEAAFFSPDGEQIPFRSSAAELGDEQGLVTREYSFLNSTYFDEIYHARTAWEHLHGIFPYEISHPPLGKLILSLGILLFGMTPFGWRFSGTLIGVLMLPVLYIFVKKLFSSTRVAACATLVFATDFMHFVQTRIATIDTYAVFFILLMYLFMALFIASGKTVHLALSGLFFGVGAACKWTCLYAGAGLAVIWAAYWIAHRREGLAAFARNVLACLLFFVLVPATIYYLSYLPYGQAAGIRGIFTRPYLDMVLNNQVYMFSYHSNLVAEHPYASVWYQWMLDIRPILYYLQYFNDGTRSSFGAFLNPVLCWGGLLALFVLVFQAVYRHDWKAAFLAAGYFAQLVPWMFVSRLTFAYHYFPCSVFLVLALAYVFKLMENGTKHYRACIYSFTGLSVFLFLLFYPALSGAPVNNVKASQVMGWLPTWPF